MPSRIDEWAERIERRRGQRVAIAALARKLAGILYAMWREGVAYDPARVKEAVRNRAEQVA